MRLTRGNMFLKLSRDFDQPPTMHDETLVLHPLPSQFSLLVPILPHPRIIMMDP